MSRLKARPRANRRAERLSVWRKRRSLTTIFVLRHITFKFLFLGAARKQQLKLTVVPDIPKESLTILLHCSRLV